MTSDSKEKSGSGPIPVSKMLGQSSALSTLKARTHLHQKLLQRIQASLPESLSDHCLACVLRVDGLLVIYTNSPAWASQLRFYQTAMSSAVASVGRVRQIKVRILNPLSPKAAKQAAGSVKVPDEAVLKQLLSEAQSNQDEEIRQALVALVEAMRHRLQVNRLEAEFPPGKE